MALHAGCILSARCVALTATGPYVQQLCGMEQHLALLRCNTWLYPAATFGSTPLQHSALPRCKSSSVGRWETTVRVTGDQEGL